MKITQKKINELKINPKNVRIHGEKQIDEFVKSIKMFGVIRPVVIDDKGVILAGNGLYMALKKMGKKVVDVIEMKGLSEEEKAKLMLADNKIYALGVDNFQAIDNILSELTDFEIPGFSSEELERLYGATSLKDDIKKDYTMDDKEANSYRNKNDSSFNVSDNVKKQQQEVEAQQLERKYLICTNCGEIIYVD